jgi:hypothetical protein
MELHEALGRISEIRAKVTATETFRGFRSFTVGSTGLMAFVGAAAQAYRLDRPTEQVGEYVSMWVGVAMMALIVAGSEVWYRYSTTESLLRRRLTVLIVQQFAPCMVAGAALTAVIVTSANQVAWMLPGLWAIVFSLGVLAICRFLPRAAFWVGAYYLASGTLCLALGNVQPLAPWKMAVTFGVGQLLAGGVLYFNVERADEPNEA